MKIHPLLLLILLAAVISGLVLQYRSLLGLRGENESLRQQLNQLERLQSQYELASRSAAQPADSRPDSELLRLRAEVTKLHDQVNRQAAENERKGGDLQEQQQQTTLPSVLSESNNMVTYLNSTVGPDALSRGTLTLVTNKSGRTGYQYEGIDANGQYRYSYRFGPTNQ